MSQQDDGRKVGSEGDPPSEPAESLFENGSIRPTTVRRPNWTSLGGMEPHQTSAAEVFRYEREQVLQATKAAQNQKAAISKNLDEAALENTQELHHQALGGAERDAVWGVGGNPVSKSGPEIMADYAALEKHVGDLQHRINNEPDYHERTKMELERDIARAGYVEETSRQIAENDRSLTNVDNSDLASKHDARANEAAAIKADLAQQYERAKEDRIVTTHEADATADHENDRRQREEASRATGETILPPREAEADSAPSGELSDAQAAKLARLSERDAPVEPNFRNAGNEVTRPGGHEM